MNVSMFTKEEMHADQAEFRLLILISKDARDPWRSLWGHKQTTGEWRMRRVFTINRSTTKMPRECAAVGCTELQTKGSLFSFHTFPKKTAVEGIATSSEIRTGNCSSRLPCGHPHRHDFFTKGYRSRIARLSLGWSLVNGRNGLFGWNLRPCQLYKEYIQIDQRTQKYILTPWHPVQRLKYKKGEKTNKLFHKKTSRKRNQQKRQMYTQILSKNELVINAEEEGTERKQTKNKWTW